MVFAREHSSLYRSDSILSDVTKTETDYNVHVETNILKLSFIFQSFLIDITSSRFCSRLNIVKANKIG